MTQNEFELLDEWLTELRSQCMRCSTTSHCQTLACFMRGGWKTGNPINSEQATCQAHERIQLLEKLLV